MTAFDNCSALLYIDYDWRLFMNDRNRVVTANLPEKLVSHLDAIAERIDRSKSWIVREAVSEWLAEEQLRYELTLKALADVDAGRTFSHEQVLAWAEQRKRERQESQVKPAA
jgi:predicted transcriptional regulator